MENGERRVESGEWRQSEVSSSCVLGILSCMTRVIHANYVSVCIRVRGSYQVLFCISPGNWKALDKIAIS